MTTLPNNSAFPDPARGAQSSYNNQDPLSAEPGISIRAYIATKAMQGILANSEGCYTQNNKKAYSPEQISELAVQHADALIEQLNKK